MDANEDGHNVSFDMEPWELRESLLYAREGESEETDNSNVPYGEEEGTPTAAQREATFFHDVTVNPAKAALLFYLNSGMFRFEQHMDHTAAADQQNINLDQVQQDIDEELLTNKEYDTVIRQFYERHPFVDFTMKSCAACGMRQIQRAEEPTIEYVDMPLSHPMLKQFLRFTPQQTADFMRRRNASNSVVEIPVDISWNQRTVNLTDAESFFQTQDEDGSNVLWHLHPELVHTLPDGDFSVALCPLCHDSMILNRKLPKLSIASGVDFGYFCRLGLTYPNLHEQLILSRTRLYFSIVKVSSNSKGQVNQNTRNKARCHSIMFPHDATDVVSHMFGSGLRGENGLLEPAGLQKLLHLYMVDPQGRPDEIAKDIFKTVNLLARPHVVAQWLLTLKWIHPHYADIDVTDLKRVVTEALERTKQEMFAQCSVIDDPDALSYEMGLGSDVAQVRNTEVLHSNTREQPVQRDAQSQVEFNDISYSYVTNNEAAYYSGGKDDFRLAALEAFADYYSGDSSNNAIGDECCDFNESDIHAYLQRNPMSGMHFTARGELPLDDFEKDDRNLSTSFPQVFMLGRAYSRQPGRLSSDQRTHLLNQFHMVPSKDRRLLGFLFDIRQRSQVMDGVKAHVEGSRDSIVHITGLLKRPEERAKLKHAIQNPNTGSAKKILNKYLKHLIFSSKSVNYGVLEGSKLRHCILGSSNRYSAPTTFLTLSPGTIDNPRSIRAAVATTSNYSFPSVFEEGCPVGADGSDFLEGMQLPDDASIIAEGTIQFPKSKRAELAIENPVAFVQEYKTMLNDVLDILLGISIEDRGYFSKLHSSSKRRSYYFKIKKGVFGHCFAAAGVGEAHEKGTLHWHLTIFAGLSPYALQRFAHLPAICAEISKVLDTMYVSHLPLDVQAGGVMHRYMRGKKTELGIDDELLRTVTPDETLLARKDPTKRLSSQTDEPTFHEDDTSPFHPGSFCEHSHEDDLSDIQGAFSDDDCSVDSVTEVSPCMPPVSTQDSGSCSPNHCVETETNSNYGCSSVSDESLGISEESVPSYGPNFVSKKRVDRDVALQASSMNFHVHMLTCHKGSQGKIGCRLCCPSATVEKTGPVMLHPRHSLDNPDEPQTPMGEDRPRVWDATEPSGPDDDLVVPKHHLVDILKKPGQDETIVVWETKRPVLLASELETDPLLQPDPSAAIVRVLRSLLMTVPSFGANNKLFWNWIDKVATQEQLLDIFQHLKTALPAANGFIASFSPIISLCTGAHNNASLLGSLNQSMSALFYLIPYQSKSKFPLMGCLSIIDHAIEHIKKYKSTASDSGARDRTVKHLLTRIINRIHLQIEMSDYQMAAALLDLPSMIYSDPYCLGCPTSIRALIAQLKLVPATEGSPLTFICQQRREDIVTDSALAQTDPAMQDQSLTTEETLLDTLSDGEDNHSDPETLEDDAQTPALPSELLHPLGYTRKVYVVFPNETSDKPGETIVLPVSAFYLYRGEALKDMNYYEYLACVEFKNKKPRSVARDATDKRLQEHFRFDPTFAAPDSCHHVLRRKQHTPLIKGRMPRHPGTKPANGSTTRWQTQADSYASFYLTLFRPENAHSNFGYSWVDLEDFVSHLQNDNRIISKFRLIMMHQHMAGLKKNNKLGKMTLQYRGRGRDLWTTRQRQLYEKWQLHTNVPIYTRTPFDERHTSLELSQATLKQMHKRLLHDSMQVQCVRQPASGSTIMPSRSDPWIRQIMQFASLSDMSARYDTITHWKRCDDDSSSPQGGGASTAPNNDSIDEGIEQIRKTLDTRPIGEINQQLQLFDHFASCLRNPGNDAPTITLVHGPPGVGKSFVRDAISRAVSVCGRENDNTAFNSIHAIDMTRGVTTCTDTGFDCKVHFGTVGTFSPIVLQNASDKIGHCCSIDVYNHIDEVGTQAPAHLARKSALCKVISNDDRSFGGRRTNLYGDLTQLGPVKAGLSLTQAVLDIHASSFIRENIVMPGRKNKVKRSQQPSQSILPRDTKHSKTHPYAIGVNLLTSARWFELNQQMRIKDDIAHQRIVEQLYHGLPVTQEDLKATYKLLSSGDLTSVEWLEAAILVATNRERLTLIEERAKLFANYHGTHVIRWQREMKNWEQEPAPAFSSQAMDDPVCWEHFVPGAPGFLNQTVHKDLLMVNALQVRYHSIRFDSDTQTLLEHQLLTTPLGDVIDMPRPPECVIVQLLPPLGHIQEAILDALHELSLERPKRDRNGDIIRRSNRILFPIFPHSCSWDQLPTVIRGGQCFLPSRARFRNIFPLELAFSITVHKSQGRTLDRVIVALSACGVKKCQFEFSQLLVAMSRVTEGDHIRLLLTGKTEEDKWNSILYINQLKRDPSIAYFFCGFSRPLSASPGDVNKDWCGDAWSANRANTKFEALIRSGLFST